jgi:hypothetical protein
MSIDTTRIHCTGCDFEYFETYKPISLKCRTEQGVVSYYRTTGWCYQCNRITDVEELPSIEEIRKIYAKFYRVPRTEGSWLKRVIRYFDRSYQSKLRDLAAKIAWREARSAPSRCLICGTTDIKTLNFINPNHQGANNDMDDWDLIPTLKYEESPRDRRAVAQDFRHTCGGELVHDPDDKPGSRYFWSERVIWLDIDGTIVTHQDES